MRFSDLFWKPNIINFVCHCKCILSKRNLSKTANSSNTHFFFHYISKYFKDIAFIAEIKMNNLTRNYFKLPYAIQNFYVKSQWFIIILCDPGYTRHFKIVELFLLRFIFVEKNENNNESNYCIFRYILEQI